MNEILKYGYEEVGDLILKCNAYDYEPVGKTSKNKNQEWNIADIYPAHKLIMMVFVIIALYPNFKGGCSEYKKMLASYVVYTHLIHSVQ